MSWSADAAGDAVEKLARRYRIKVWWVAPDGPEAHIGTRQIWANPTIREYDYLAALHELGHIVDPDAKRLHAKGNTLPCEAAAWQWAIDHLDPLLVTRLSKATRKRVRNAWATYLPDEVD